jgi:DNA polymerase elongation subunit (family B)
MYECGQAVTGFARETIDIVRKQMLNVGIQPLTIDTDGCELLVQSAEDIKKVKETAS